MKMRLICLGMAICSACAGADDSVATQIDHYIGSLPYLPVEPAGVTSGARTAPMQDNEYTCSTQNVSETRQYDRIIAYAANSEVLYPGAIITADSALTGLFTQISLPRRPMTISVSLENIDGDKSAEVKDPSLSSFREALSSILESQITGSTPANLFSEIEEVHSDEQLNLALGVQASWGLGIVSLKSTFNWDSKTTRSRYIVRYTQGYYTVDVDAPSAPSQVFDSGVTLADVKDKMDEGRPPAYVSSVTYGRLVVFTFESDFSSQELGAALEFAYSGGLDVSGDVSVKYREIIENSKITAFILGGDGGGAAQTIDSYDALINFIKAGGNYSRESPGAPIAYKLSYLKDNTPARMSFTTNFDVKECARISQQVRVTVDSITVESAGDDIDKDLEIFGVISAVGTNTSDLWTKTSSTWIQIDEHETYPAAGAGPLAEGLINVAPQPGQSIKLQADLKDWDTFVGGGIHELGVETKTYPFESGWRRSSETLTLTGSGRRVTIKLSMSPI
jgi:thiol-activated cytolysin